MAGMMDGDCKAKMAAFEALQPAQKKYDAAVRAYRAGELDDEAFLAARAEFKVAEKIYDEAYAAAEGN